MLRTGPLLYSASEPASRPTPGVSLPGTLASPRAGLAPVGCRELVARLRHEVVSFLTASEAAGRTLDYIYFRYLYTRLIPNSKKNG